MPKREIPQHWQVLLERKGISSARRLAEKADMSHGTAVRIIFNDGYRTTEENLQKIAKALDVDLKTVYALVGRNTPVAEEWTPPAESARLTPEQRQVIEQLIHVMVSTPKTKVEPDLDLPLGEPDLSPRIPPEVGLSTFEQRRQERLALLGHPERDGLRLAADRSHGPSLTQTWDEED